MARNPSAVQALSEPEILAAYPEIAEFVALVKPRLEQLALQREALQRFREHVEGCIARGDAPGAAAGEEKVSAFDSRDLSRVDAELGAIRAETALLTDSVEEQLRLSVNTISVLERVVQERSDAVAALEDACHGALLSSRPAFAAYWTGTADRLEATLASLRKDAAASTAAVLEQVGKMRGTAPV